MSTQVMLVNVDCAEPRKLAEWWVEAFGGEVTTDLGDFVIARIEVMPLLMGFQRVPEPKSGKNRIHLDFGTDDRLAEVDRLSAIGATAVGEHSIGDFSWTVMTDPVGNEFCVATRPPSAG